MTTNATAEVLELARANDGELPPYSFPGGYPLAYLDALNNVLCDICATDTTDSDPKITAAFVNWEDQHLACDSCGGTIEVAYPDEG